jgi:surface protein
MSGLGLGLGLGLGAHRKVGGEPYSDVLALEYDLRQITEPTTIALAIKADSSWFDAGQEVSIDWGDGTTPDVVNATSGQSGYISHEYTTAGTYMVKVSGTMKVYRRAGKENIAGQGLLTHIRSFGKLGIESFTYAFYNCTNLVSVPKHLPVNVSFTNFMFYGCSDAAFNPDVSNWDVSNVKNMFAMFRGCSGAAFNPDVSNWDVSNVSNMSYMFNACSGAAFRGGRGTAGTGIANWTPDSLTIATSFMLSSKKQKYGFLDSILITWADLIDDIEHPLPEDITINFGTNTYTAAASAAILALENHGWVISSGGLVE